jgi:glutamine phosphoribosylpyrophosphate amidotransferase
LNFITISDSNILDLANMHECQTAFGSDIKHDCQTQATRVVWVPDSSSLDLAIHIRPKQITNKHRIIMYFSC